MFRYVTACLGLGFLLFASGCAICASPYDRHFAAYGGTWQRDDPSDGRVASVIHPAGPFPLRVVDEAERGWTPDEMAPRDESILEPYVPEPEYLDDDLPPLMDLLNP